MSRFHAPAALLIAGALSLTLTACGSDSSDGDAGTTPSTTTSAPAGGSSNTPAPSNSGIVPDAAWAGVFKKAVPPLASKSDDEVVAAGKRVCTTFEAAPEKATATAIFKDLESTLALDSTQSRIFASGAITHYCTDQTVPWTTASIG